MNSTLVWTFSGISAVLKTNELLGVDGFRNCFPRGHQVGSSARLLEGGCYGRNVGRDSAKFMSDILGLRTRH